MNRCLVLTVDEGQQQTEPDGWWTVKPGISAAC